MMKENRREQKKPRKPKKTKNSDIRPSKRSARLQQKEDQQGQSKKPQVAIIPEGDATEPSHHVVKRACWNTEEHKLLGSIDNLILYLVFSLLSGNVIHVKEQASSAVDCPQYWNYIEMLEESTELKLIGLMNALLGHDVYLWNHVFIVYTYDAIYAARDARLADLMREDEFLRSMARYILLKRSKRVEIRGVDFGDARGRQRGIVATSRIPKGTFLWEICGVISTDVVDSPTISSIEAHRCQGMGDGPHLLVGPIRLVNHHCDPNATFYPLLDSPGMIVLTTRQINPNEEVTTSYGKDYWNVSHCLCSSCTGAQPTYFDLQ